MKKFINHFVANSHDIYICLILYGLSISIFAKDINLFLFPNFNFNWIILYRILLVIFSIFLIFTSKKRVNFYVFLLIIINLIFLINLFFGEKISFKVNAIAYYRDYVGIIFTESDVFFRNKNKIILINIFNILLPLIVLSVINFKSNLDYLLNLSFTICKYFLISVTLYIFIKYIYILPKFDTGDVINFFFINLHSMLYILNIFFILIVDKLAKKEKTTEQFFYISLIFICFYISGSTIYIAICFITLLIYLIFFSFTKKQIILLSIIFSLSLGLLVYQDYLLNKLDINIHGSLINALYTRLMTFNFFIFESNNLNYLFGNNIFGEKLPSTNFLNIYTYPHNLLVDAMVCSGAIGLTLLIYLLINYCFISIKFIKTKNYFLVLVLFQSLVFSSLSGFFFTNIICNILLAIFFCLEKEKALKIK